MATRTQHAKRNIITSISNKLVTMLATFIMRTVIIRYLGVETAKKVAESGLTLEEYLGVTSQYAD